jgi:nicotinamide riboside kinase
MQTIPCKGCIVFPICLQKVHRVIGGSSGKDQLAKQVASISILTFTCSILRSYITDRRNDFSMKKIFELFGGDNGTTCCS